MGFLTKKKTITDMNFIELFTPDAAYRQAKFETFFTTNSMREYNDTMFQWKKDYRGRYNRRYLERAGLEPTSNATRLTIDNDLLLEYIKSQYPTTNEIISHKFVIPSLSYVSRFYLQENGYIWSNYTDTLVVGSSAYKLIDIDYADPEDDTQIIIYFENKIDPEDTYEIEFINEYHAITCLNTRYETNISTTEWYVYVEPKATVPVDLYTIDNLTMTAIIPLKENNELHEDNIWVKRMLNKLGVGGRDLSVQLEEETGIDNAYIFTGLKFNDDDQSMAKALYQSFEYLSEITIKEPEPDEDGITPLVDDHVNFTMSEMELGYDFDISIETKSGVATHTYDRLNTEGQVEKVTELLKVGSYTSSLNEDESSTSFVSEEEAEIFETIVNPWIDGQKLKGDSYLKIRYQISPNTFKEMTITNYVNTFTISGFNFTAYLDSDEENGRLIIPLDVLNKLRFRDFIAVHDRSFTLLAYSHQVVKIYWYQQDWFSWVIKIGLFYWTGGASLTWDFFIDMAISYAISWGIAEILSMFDNEILMVLASVVLTAAGAMMTSGFDIADLTVENYLPIATKAIQTASNIYQETVMAEIAKLREKTEEQEKEDELLEEEMAAHNFTVTKAMMDAHYSHADINSPEAWIAQQLGFGLYNYDQYYAVSDQIDLRKQVMSG